MAREYISDLKREFCGYNWHWLFSDFLAGVTVAAVSLPLALAFGVSSGADASAGLITAIVAAVLIGTMSGASFQISGPTGAMAAILLPMAAKHGFKSVFAACLLAGFVLLAAGIFKVGRIVAFFPKAMITGFTSGVALLIVLGQIENILGVKSHGEETYRRVFNLLADGVSPNYYALCTGILVIVLIMVWPKKWGARVPGPLVAVIAAAVVQIIFAFPVPAVGAIPQTLLHDMRFSPLDILDIQFDVSLMPALSLAALCMIESLLSGTVGGKMKKEKFRADRELVAQGIGNILLPFFGGLPASAAFARTGMAIRSGAKTRLTGIFQGAILLVSMFFLGSFISRIPMSALAGVLMVTAWRMNEWADIKHMFVNRFRSSITTFLLTLVCTVIFDLTVAIAVGLLLSMVLFIIRVSNLEVTISEFDPERMEMDGEGLPHVQVIYVTGSIFFGSLDMFSEKVREATGEALVLSMRGVPAVDTSGAQEILEFCVDKKNEGVTILFCGVQPKVKEQFDRVGITAAIGEDSFFWMAEDALHSLNEKALA